MADLGRSCAAARPQVKASQLSDGMEAVTLEGAKLRFDLSSGGVKVGGAKVVLADVEVGNGVVHLIDTVLLPPPPKVSATKVTAELA